VPGHRPTIQLCAAPELIDFDDGGTATDDRVQEEILMIGRVLKKCDLKTVRKARKQVQILAE
jgi:hypothetical protein